MTSETSLDSRAEIVRFLRQPQHYSERPACVELIETHFAWVFLTQIHAYKLKKPLRTAFLDYRTIAARRLGCREELVLNRRLAPNVYLDVVPIVRNRDDTLSLGYREGARVVDWVVKMRRLPASRMLDRAIADGSVRKADLVSLACMLTRFFDGAVRQPLDVSQYAARLEERVLQNRHDLSAGDLGLDRARVQRVTALQLQFLSSHHDLLGPRAACLIDGHGDLRPEHLYLGSGSEAPCVIDCLEFDSQLRWLDPAEEMAFLALECRKLGASAAARTLVSHYRSLTLAPPSEGLIDFYMSYSALTRAKLAAWHVRDPQFAPRAAAWRGRALSYLADSVRLITRALRAPPASARINPRPDSLRSQANERAEAPADSHPTSASPLARIEAQ